MAQAIVTKFLAPTNTRGSRIKVTSWQGSSVHSWDYSIDSNENHAEAIKAHIDKIASEASTRQGYEIAYRIVGWIPGNDNSHRWMGSNPSGKGYIALVI